MEAAMSEAGIKEVFVEEFREIVGNLESDIVSLEEHSGPELIDNIFRYVHTIKGSSGIAGFSELYEFTHQLENLLDLVRSGELKANEGITDLLLSSLDWMKLTVFGGEIAAMDQIRETLLENMVKYIGDNREKEPEKSDTKRAIMVERHRKRIEEEGIGYRYFEVKAEFKEGIFESGIDPLRIMEDFVSMGTVIKMKIDRRRLPDFHEMDPERCYTGWELILKTKRSVDDIMNTFLFVRDDNNIIIEDITIDYVEGEVNDYLEEKRLGEILVKQGFLTEDELEEVISAQDADKKKLGELVVERGYATDNEVRYALSEQDDIRRRVETATVRVDTGKLDKLMNLLGEIVIGQSSIRRIADELDDEMGYRLKNALYGVDRTTREFQEQLMAIRMIPIGPTFEQFRRFVRDASHEAGKSIRFEISGRETELDKTVIERISDPLKHLIRNAIDHGIETADERIEAGKSKTGTIRLSAYHQEGSIYIEVTDDGRGINRDKTRKKALSMGLIGPDEEPSDDRLLSFLFVPGFSTADRVGELSGRGVGMDVVKTNVEALRGTVAIDSTEGLGTTFQIKLPLTLAIIEGMLVRVGEHRYIIPLLSIVESMQPKPEDLKTVEKRGEVVLVRGEYVTLLRLYELFGIKADITNPSEGLVVIVESAGIWIGLLIDELLGQQQIVIKNLGNQITKSRALSGAAILGDGRIALIMDIHGLLGEIAA
jgi:two-component system chemotaxis sensor kinase CheA